jgi:translation initiation factor 2 subunit 1
MKVRIRQINDLKKAFPVGKVLVLQVVGVDNVRGYIDLSNEFDNPEEVDKCNLRYAKSKQVENIVKLLALRTYKSMEAIYKKVIWPLYKTHNHALDALKEIIVNGNLSILNRLNVNDEIKNELMNILKKRWKYIPIKIRADFKLTCFNFDGIEAIKEALLKGEKKKHRKYSD